MRKKNMNQAYYTCIKKMTETKIQIATMLGICLRCEGSFPKEEFKILTNPITKEKRPSYFCNTCRPINLAEVKKRLEV